MIQYFDDRGWCYRVMAGIQTFAVIKGRWDKADKDIFNIAATLLWRDRIEDAEAYLHFLAAKRGWRRGES